MNRAFGVSLVASLSIASIASAEEAPASSGLRISVAPAFATISRTTSYALFGSMDPESESQMTGDGLGGQLEIGGAGRVNQWVDLGGMLRISRLPLAVKSDDDGMSRDGDLSLRAVHIGPQVTFRFGSFYLRGDLALGTMSSSTDLPVYTLHSEGLLGLVETGAEFGYRTRLRKSTSAGFGIGSSVSWVRSNEDGDHGEYTDRTRVVAVTLAASLVVTP